MRHEIMVIMYIYAMDLEKIFQKDEACDPIPCSVVVVAWRT